MVVAKLLIDSGLLTSSAPKNTPTAKMLIQQWGRANPGHKQRSYLDKDKKARVVHYLPQRVPQSKTKLFVQTDEFLKSREWRELRYLALLNCKGTCQLCGAKRKDGIILHVDHIKPRSTHPALALKLDNLQVLCEDCNMGKGAWDDTDWR